MAEAEHQSQLPQGEIISRTNSLKELLDFIREGKDVPSGIVEGALVSLLVLISSNERDDLLDSLLVIPGIDVGLIEDIDYEPMHQKDMKIEDLSADLASAYRDHIETLIGVILDSTSEEAREEYGMQLLSTLCDLEKVRKEYDLLY